MTDPAAWSFLAAIVAAAGLDIAANLLLAKSEGFSRIRFGLAALAMVGLAFICLAYALRGLDLAVAYALWGSFGVLGTSLGGAVLLGQRLRAPAWAGIAMLIAGVGLLHLS
jgi:spermidine export protein MdtI